MKQIASLEDTETIIRIDYHAKTLHIYTNRASVVNRLIKLYEADSYTKVDGEMYSMTFKFSTKLIGKFLRTSIFKFD